MGWCGNPSWPAVPQLSKVEANATTVLWCLWPVNACILWGCTKVFFMYFDYNWSLCLFVSFVVQLKGMFQFPLTTSGCISFFSANGLTKIQW